jgi:hypothetical protein
MIETLYFYCYYAYLLGDLENAQMYYDILRQEFKTAKQDQLKSHQYLELKKIKEALVSGNISRCQWLNEPVPVMAPAQSVDIKQKELIRRIHFGALDNLKELLQDDIYLYEIEFPCPPYGFVDMVYRGKNTVYPIEVKRDQGKHDLIGQICKYDLFHRLKLHQKHYEFVKSVTICQSYQTHVLREIKQLDILPMCYNMENKGISLKSP